MKAAAFSRFRAASRSLLPLLLACCSLAACTDDAESPYAKGIKAFLRIDDLTGAQLLRAALQSPGTFCTITTNNARHTVTAYNGQTNQLNITAVEQSYGRTESICGFIAGTPSVPDMNGTWYNIAFDLACRNCYENDELYLRIALAFDSPVTVRCRRCSRIYDLENLGIVISGEAGRPLFRYRIFYDGVRLVIQN
ncbi:MAG: hypothetical protein J1F06_01445 [Prevotellaceae bacterium]|nr:hypothetical protein [Prevotellaceae bacterium]